MSERNDGGPAFPRAGSPYPGPDGDFSETGMTLRDYFAAKAMQGLVASDGGNDMSCEQTARIAYLIANNMLAEREE